MQIGGQFHAIAHGDRLLSIDATNVTGFGQTLVESRAALLSKMSESGSRFPETNRLS